MEERLKEMGAQSCCIGAWKTLKVCNSLFFVSIDLECIFDLQGNVFSLNEAAQSGGAIYYDLFPP